MVCRILVEHFPWAPPLFSAEMCRPLTFNHQSQLRSKLANSFVTPLALAKERFPSGGPVVDLLEASRPK